MWPVVEHDLGQLLGSKVFPSLRRVPEYEKLLKPNGQPDAAACKTWVHTLLSSSDLTSGIRELGSRENPAVREWTKPLCRAVSRKNNPNGYWWFDEELVQRWARKYPAGTANRRQEILDSIRPMLAVCFDWNDFTDLRILRPNGSIPVIKGQGTHKPIYSPSDPKHAATSNVLFIGGYTQVFVPFVNPALTSDYAF